MALLPSRQRDQVMVLVSFVAIALSAAYFVYVWQPKRLELAEMEIRLQALDDMNQRAKSDIQRGSVAQIKKQAEEAARNLEVMRTLVPMSNEVPALLEQVSTAARQAGLELGEVTPQGVHPGDVFDTYKFRIGVEGSYHKVAALLANVASLQRIVTPMNIQLSAAVFRPASEHRPRKDEQLLDAKFEIQTYVVKSSPAPTSVAVTSAGQP